MVFTKNEVERLMSLRGEYVGRHVKSVSKCDSGFIKRDAQIVSIYFDMDRECLVVAVDKPEYSPLLQKDCGLCGKMRAMDIVEEKLASYGEMRLAGHNQTDWAFDHDFDELENFLAGQEA